MYASATIDKATNEVILKVVNTLGRAQSMEVALEGVKKIDTKARVLTLQNDNLEAENTFESPSVVAPVEMTLNSKGKVIQTELKPYSLSIIRVKLYK